MNISNPRNCDTVCLIPYSRSSVLDQKRNLGYLPELVFTYLKDICVKSRSDEEFKWYRRQRRQSLEEGRVLYPCYARTVERGV